MEESNKDEMNIGIVKISDEVVSVIAGIAASEITGVVEISPGVTTGITQMITGKKNVGKGVKVNVEDGATSVDIILSVLYGVRIPEVVSQVQENVKKTVEAITGLKVSAVNVFVQNIVVPKDEEKKEIIED
jgi:uncharacterized alkaline shock family protein YloU